MGQKRLWGSLLIAALLLIAPVYSACALENLRIRGGIDFKTYGYQDTAGDNHQWLFHNTNFSVWQGNSPLSFHFSGGYLGDNADDFSQSGRGRLTKAYLQYGKFGDKNTLKAGRFFLTKGVGLGVLDGVDFSTIITPRYKASVYVGMMGPMNREFEFEKPSDAFSFGGELKWLQPIPYLPNSIMGLSYTNQSRNGEIYRHLIGLNSQHNFKLGWQWLNTVQLRLSGSPLRKAITRLRYFDDKWSLSAEAGILTPAVESYSWFNDFGEGTIYERIRFSADRWLVPAKWAVGAEGGMLIAGESGFRGGPVVSTPFGQAGYRFASGNQAQASGPWVNAKYALPEWEFSAYWAMIDYQWDSFDIEQDDLMMLYAGAAYVPFFWNNIKLYGQFQYFTNPEFTQDKRGLFGITYNFDNRECCK